MPLDETMKRLFASAQCTRSMVPVRLQVPGSEQDKKHLKLQAGTLIAQDIVLELSLPLSCIFSAMLTIGRDYQLGMNARMLYEYYPVWPRHGVDEEVFEID